MTLSRILYSLSLLCYSNANTQAFLFLRDEGGLGEELALFGLLLAALLDLELEFGAILSSRSVRSAVYRWGWEMTGTYLVNVWLGSCSASYNLLDKLGNFGHNVDTVPSLAHVAS